MLRVRGLGIFNISQLVQAWLADDINRTGQVGPAADAVARPPGSNTAARAAITIMD